MEKDTAGYGKELAYAAYVGRKGRYKNRKMANSVPGMLRFLKHVRKFYTSAGLKSRPRTGW
jgi:hypothetical protein